MKRVVYLSIFLAFVAAACAPQPISTEGPDPVLGAEFTLENALGGQTSLADFAGEPVLLYFHMAVG